jgi:hypothetical protein
MRCLCVAAEFGVKPLNGFSGCKVLATVLVCQTVVNDENRIHHLPPSWWNITKLYFDKIPVYENLFFVTH